MSNCVMHGKDKVGDAASVLRHHHTKESIVDLAASLEQRCTQWIETGDPASIQVLMKETLQELFPDADDDSRTRDFLAHVLKETRPTGSRPCVLLDIETVRLLRETNPRQTLREDESKAQIEDNAGEKVLRRIQLQTMLRLHLWTTYGRRFLDLYAKSPLAKITTTRRKKKKKQKSLKTTPEDLLLQETASILALAAFQLPPDSPFPAFVHSTLCAVPHLPPKAPEYIYDKFEIQTPEQNKNQNAYSPRQKRTSKRKRSSLNSTGMTNPSSDVQSQTAPPKQTTPKSSSVPSQNSIADKEGGEVWSSLLPRRVQLTAPTTKRRNSLLGNSSSGSRFVGSHFNTTLSNMDSLFHQVKSTKKQPFTSSTGKTNSGKVQRQKQEPLIRRPNNSASAVEHCNTPQEKTKRTAAAVNTSCTIQPERIVVHETPCKQREQQQFPQLTQRRTSLFVAETYVAGAAVGQRQRAATAVAQARRAIQARSERRR